MPQARLGRLTRQTSGLPRAPAALVPRPRSHLVRYHGLLVPNARHRTSSGCAESTRSARAGNWSRAIPTRPSPEPACCDRASRRSSRTRSPSGSTSSRRVRSIGSAATRRTSPASISACPVRVGHAADLLANDLTPSDRRPAQRRQAVAACCLPVPRLLPRRTHPGRSCCSRWSRSSRRSAGCGGSGTRRYGR